MTHELATTLDRLLLIVFQWITKQWEVSRKSRTKGDASVNLSLSSCLSFNRSLPSSPHIPKDSPSSRSILDNSSSSLTSSLSTHPPADEGFNSLWRQLLSVFQKTILPSGSTTHLQFVLFYVSGLSPSLTDAFLDFLWKRVRDAAQPEVIRRAASSYIASFVARANFCNDLTVRATFGNLLAWADR